VIVGRYACLVGPGLLVLVGLRLERDRNARMAALLASIAAAVGIAALTPVAERLGWWRFATVDGSLAGLPVDAWLGWAALWGAVPVLVRRYVALPVALGFLLWLDLVTMPALDPLVRLGSRWLVGEVAGLLAIALPAQLLGRWTAQRRHLHARILLQVTVFSALALWLVPATAFALGDGAWPRSSLVLALQLGALLAAPGLAAVREFAVRGGGTPYPWDPPVRLVSTGPYAYVANPMQLSVVGLLLLLAALGHSRTLVAVAVAAVAFSVAVAGPHEDTDLTRRYRHRWRWYRGHVRLWWPRWTPYPATGALWLDEDCGACAAVGRFLSRRNPHGLRILPAEAGQMRARYAGGDGHEERGVAAVARALEHINLGWAYLGWVLRLPGVAWLAQTAADAFLAAPHPASGRQASDEEICHDCGHPGRVLQEEQVPTAGYHVQPRVADQPVQDVTVHERDDGVVVPGDHQGGLREPAQPRDARPAGDGVHLGEVPGQ
jgi:protein-S-isoprenylcysteine O-methyltransferase Ste14